LFNGRVFRFSIATGEMFHSHAADCESERKSGGRRGENAMISGEQLVDICSWNGHWNNEDCIF